MNRYSCDFETVNDVDDCRVWLWGQVELYNHDNFKWGLNLESFFDWVATLESGSTLYFHNLKFDGEFMLYFLFKNGFTWTDRKRIYDREFKTLITDTGVWYALSLNINDNIINIYDSLKIISLPVSKIGKAFGLAESKGDIDYNKNRPVGYQPDENEIDYLRKDVSIVASSLEKMIDDDHTKMTQASNAMTFYKNLIGKKKFKKFFPVLRYDIDKYLRQSYRGGWTFVNPNYQNMVVGKGMVVDNNSIYPYVMNTQMLPYGEPIYFKGKYEEDDIYNLHISTFRCQFELKPDHVPTIQLKHNLGFKPTEYVTSSNDEEVTLCMTSIDIELFFEQYDVYNLEWFDGWKFKSTNILFKEYIKYWSSVKIESKKQGNKGMYTISKFFLNMLYGKFGLNPNVQSKIPVYHKDKNKVKYVLGKEETRDPIYVPLASFVTAYARGLTIRGAQQNYERFMYADTDSLHMLGWETPDNLELHPTKLGAWDIELYFKKARYIHAKCYIEENDHNQEGEKLDGVTIACAGLPNSARDKIGFNDFVVGMSVGGKLQMKRVPNGIVLLDTDFTIKW